MEKLQFEYPTIIQEIDVDAFGHVNNANYLRLFEQARWDFICARGFNLETMKRNQEGPVILEVNVRFMRELKPRDAVMIKSVTEHFDGKFGKLRQWIERDGKMCAEAVFKVGFWSLKDRKLINASQAWLFAVGVTSEREPS